MIRYKDIVITGPAHSGRTTLANVLADKLGLQVVPPWVPSINADPDRERLIFDGCPLVQSHCNSDMMGPAHVGAAHPRLIGAAIVVFCIPPFGRLRNVDFDASHRVYDRWMQACQRWPGLRAPYRWDDKSLRETLALSRFEALGVLN